MLGFIVPFKSRHKSKNWEHDSFLLRQTLTSLLNQRDPNFRCYVVYTDMPLNCVTDERVRWIHFPYPFVELEEMGDKETFIKKNKAQNNAPLFFDQGKRVLYGCQFAKTDGCDYVMMFDADDLASSQISEFVNRASQFRPFGWFVDKGYIYRLGKRFLQKVPQGMNQMHGSVNIVRTDLVPTPEFDDMRLESYVFFAHHTYLWQLVQTWYGNPLTPLPFYATIYIAHDTGWSTALKDLNRKEIRVVLKRILRAKHIGKKIKKEFGFPG